MYIHGKYSALLGIFFWIKSDKMFYTRQYAFYVPMLIKSSCVIHFFSSFQ